MPARQVNPDLTSSMPDAAIMALFCVQPTFLIKFSFKVPHAVPCDPARHSIVAPSPTAAYAKPTSLSGSSGSGAATNGRVTLPRTVQGATSPRPERTGLRLSAASSFFWWTARHGVRVLAGNRGHVHGIAGLLQRRESVAVAAPASKRDVQKIDIDIACCLDVCPTA